jgi:hypothetical protein
MSKRKSLRYCLLSFECIYIELTLIMVLIKNAATEHASVAVSSVIDRKRVGEIIDECELRTLLLIVASDQQPHLICVTSSQVVSQVLASEISSSFGAELVAISHFVQENVFGDVFDELNSVALVASGSNQQRVGDFVDLVLIWREIERVIFAESLSILVSASFAILIDIYRL